MNVAMEQEEELRYVSVGGGMAVRLIGGVYGDSQGYQTETVTPNAKLRSAVFRDYETALMEYSAILEQSIVSLVGFGLTDAEKDFVASSLLYIHKLGGVWNVEQTAKAKAIVDKLTTAKEPDLEVRFNVVTGKFGGIEGGFTVYVCGCIANNRGYYIQCFRHFPEYNATGLLSQGGLGIVRHTLDSFQFVCPFGADYKSPSWESMNNHLGTHGALVTEEQTKLPKWTPPSKEGKVVGVA